MPYQAEISRITPSGFLFLIDQSGSMLDQLESGKTKAQFLADVLNRTLYQLVILCTKDANGIPRDYFDIGVLAYNENIVRNGLGGPLCEKVLHPISEIEASPLRIDQRVKKSDDGAGGLVEQSIKFPVWFDPIASGGTPMCEALRRTAEILVPWCDTHRTSRPPTVIHVTDGQSTDGDPEPIVEKVRMISTDDGSCLFFNLHVASGGAKPAMFPDNEHNLPDTFSKLLFRCSSYIPEHQHATAREKGYNVGLESRFFAYNSDLEGIVNFFDIGTRAANMR